MALIQIILVTAAILIIIWLVVTLIKSTLKVIWSIVLGVFLLLVISGTLLYIDYKGLKESFEGEKNLFVLHENENIILSSAIIINSGENQTFQLEPVEIDSELKDLLNSNATVKDYNMVVSMEKALLEEGINESIEILGTRIDKDIYFDILEGEIDADAFSAIAGGKDIEEEMQELIDTKTDADTGLRNIALATGLNEVRKENGYRWLRDKYSEEYIEIIPEPFVLKIIRLFPF